MRQLATRPRNSAGAARAAMVAALVVGFLLAALLFLDPFGWHPLDERLRGEESVNQMAGDEEGTLWTCGMHPQVIQDEPGQCPICHMDLVPLESTEGGSQGAGSSMAGSSMADAGAHEGHDHAMGEELWTCPMHPNILEEEPGSCPICGMDLVPVEASAPMEDPGSTGSDGMAMEATEVRIDPVMVQTMNVRTETVRREELAQRIRTVGYLEYDQDRMVTVTTKYRGWIENVYVHYLGEEVRRGQPMFEIYAPELVQTQRELLSALEFARRMDGASEGARQRAQALVEAARQRLAYWDVTDSQLERLESSGEVFRTLTVYAPASGVVMKTLPGLEGMAVQPGMELFHLADLSTLWLSVELYEDQVAWVREGTEAEITLTYFPGETFTGRVQLVAPEMSAETRTLPVRLAIPNREGRLRPGMFATVRFAQRDEAAQPPLTVSSQAVLRDGRRSLVVLALGGGRFLPREVTLGRESEGRVEVLAGLEAGEEVVTSAQFLLDSESSLAAAIQKLVAARRAEAMGGSAQSTGSGAMESDAMSSDPMSSDPMSSDHRGH
ncbi:MAG: efflux RND transporter periplasmic adaptor subunit [Acidobacteriota bacterium]|nr:efflux RND transporter periplasmic adaptor subunit [Acidobacteriota bacterium]